MTFEIDQFQILSLMYSNDHLNYKSYLEVDKAAAVGVDIADAPEDDTGVEALREPVHVAAALASHAVGSSENSKNVELNCLQKVQSCLLV